MANEFIARNGITSLGNIVVSGSLTTTGPITISGSIASASYAASASNALSASNAVIAQTSSYANALTVAGTLTAQTLVVQTITSSVDFVTGSTRFGSLLTNTHVFSGSVTMNPNGLFVSSSGLVGIGTTSPSTLLHIKGPSATLTIADDTSYAAGVGGKLSLHGNYRSVGDITEGGYVKISKTNSTNGDYGFDMIFATSNYTAGVAERLRITSTGNVGIGVTDPDIFGRGDTRMVGIGASGASDNLALALNAGGSGGRGAQIYMGQGGTRHFTISSNVTETRVGTATSTPLILTTNDTTRLTISSTGAATFSGSVTATQFTSQGGRGTSYGYKLPDWQIYNTTSGNALTFNNYTTDLLTISLTGNILINQTSALAGVPVSVEMSGNGSSTPTLQASYNVYANHGAANTTWRGYYVFHRSRGTTSGSVTAVAADDYLGTIRWNGTDGTGEIIAAEINAMVDGTVGTNDMPTRLTFSTTADGSSSPTERLRITNSGQVRVIGVGNTLAFDTDGSGASTALGTNGQYDFRIYNGRGGASNIDVSTYSVIFGANGSTNRFTMGNSSFYPSADNSYTCGASGNRWSAIWAANGTIQTSDARQKKDITDSNLGLEFINKLRPVSYKWKVGKNVVTVDGERIDENGATQSNDIITPVEGTRTHYGLIAQEVKEALGDVDFGGYVHDEETDTLALRYDQFISPLIKAIQELKAENDSLKSRIEILESK